MASLIHTQPDYVLTLNNGISGRETIVITMVIIEKGLKVPKMCVFGGSCHFPYITASSV